MRVAIADTAARCSNGEVQQDAVGIEVLTKHLWGRNAVDWILPIMWSVTRKYPKGVFAEIGTRSGISAMVLAMAARDVGGRAYTMDISEDHRADAVHNLGVLGLGGCLTMIRGDSRKTDFPEPVDVLFIDGDHSYEGVRADYLRHEPNVRSGGTIFFHDPVSCEGVGEFLREVGGFILPIEAGLGIISKGAHAPAGVIDGNY